MREEKCRPEMDHAKPKPRQGLISRKLFILRWCIVLISWSTSSLALAAPGAPTLVCTEAPEVTGPKDGWSKISTCPQGTIGVGVAKLDLLGSHEPPTVHVNDLRCDDQGCKVYCIGNPCKLKARCCKIAN